VPALFGSVTRYHAKPRPPWKAIQAGRGVPPARLLFTGQGGASAPDRRFHRHPVTAATLLSVLEISLRSASPRRTVACLVANWRRGQGDYRAEQRGKRKPP